MSLQDLTPHPINSAGVDADPPPVQGASIARWQRAMQLNVNGSILCSKHVVDAMERAGGGAIVNVLSLCDMTGRQQTSADFAAKAAMRKEGDLTQTLIDIKQSRQTEDIGLSSNVAAAVLYLVSKTGRFITGSELVIDAGYSWR
ncbi:short chain dehydrogenase family protein [Collimonas fungivorans]|uniref:Short chain dehydrogenase family protein n=1 Tax=Collimonas fungivorans TaxID=158899 RepID=A0A127P4H3_9BURK|nr:SDR family oxidoreductase [Collimonas fungivorans]AMO92739.1 short chain dehydrogenase family protein [Collimonas fungivorans]